MNTRTVRIAIFIGAVLAGGVNPAPAQMPLPDTAIPAADFNQPEGAASHLGELEALAIDVARRTVLAYHPHAANLPMYTLEVRVRPEGDLVHTYARLHVRKSHKPVRKHRKLAKLFHSPERLTEAEVFATFIYTPGYRRLVDVSYEHDRLIPFRLYNRTADIVTMYNREFENRDDLRMRVPLVGQRTDMLAPRSHKWMWNPLQGDHGWHAFMADDYVAPGWSR